MLSAENNDFDPSKAPTTAIELVQNQGAFGRKQYVRCCAA